jgi:hypothetical protein
MTPRLAWIRPWLPCLVLAVAVLGCSAEPESVEVVEIEPPPPPPIDSPIAPGPQGPALPAGFPEDVSRYAGAELTGVTEEEGSLFVQMRTDDALEPVIGYYLRDLASQGWTVERRDDPENPGLAGMVFATKGGRTTSVFVRAAEAGALIDVFYQPGT